MKPLRIAILVAALIAAALSASGCAKTEDHSWKGEFDARLEGAAETVEEAREVAERIRHPIEYLTVLSPIGARLFFKSELVKELDPPASCEAVQVKGKAAVFGAADRIGGLYKDLTPSLEHNLSSLFEDEIATIEKREREAETCA